MEYSPKRAEYSAETNPLTPSQVAGDDQCENPGDPFSVHGLYCETCKKSVSAEELAGPAHIGHGLVNGSPDFTPDISGIGKSGGSYRIKWKTDGVGPNEDY